MGLEFVYEVEEPLPVDDWLLAEILDIGEKAPKEKPDNIYWRWKFAITLPTGEERVFYDNSAATSKNTTKPGKWIANALGGDYKALAGRHLTLDDLLGQKLYIMIENGQPTADGAVRQSICKTKPLPVTAATPPPTTNGAASAEVRDYETVFPPETPETSATSSETSEGPL